MTYTLGCGPTKGRSALQFKQQGTTGILLSYMTSDTPLPIEGTGPFVLEDVGGEFFNETFDTSRPCNLKVSWDVLPSGTQLKAWSDSSAAIVAAIKDNVAIYAKRADLDFWYQTHLENPEKDTILQQQIDALKEGTASERNYAKQLAKIINQASKDEIFKPYDIIKGEMTKQVQSANDLIAAMAPYTTPVLQAALNAKSQSDRDAKIKLKADFDKVATDLQASIKTTPDAAGT
jgi:hypothetical protein